MIPYSQLTRINNLTKQLANAILKQDTYAINNIGKDLQVIYTEVYGNVISNSFGRDTGRLALENMIKNAQEFSAGKVISIYKDIVKINPSTTMDLDELIKPIENTHNNLWLKTEIQSADSQATMARKWDDFSKMGGAQTGVLMLKYTTANDDRVRDEHAALDGIIRPMNDPFWNSHMPPLDYNCRCSVIASRNFEPTPKGDVPSVLVPKEFSFNAGKDGIVFSPSHPYMTDTKGIKDLLDKNKLV